MESTTEIIKWSIGSGVIGSILTAIVVTFLSKVLGKKKEDIEIALSYQKYYKEHIGALENNVAELIKEVSGLKQVVLELTTENKKQRLQIENQAKNLKDWEESNETLRGSVISERSERTKSDMRNEELEKENEKLKSK